MDRQMAGLHARVFISCGQAKGSNEVSIAKGISGRLERLGFDPYIAVGEQTLTGLTENIFKRLGVSEYFVFVDFLRSGWPRRGAGSNVDACPVEARCSPIRSLR
jgi:hypothetical protein